MRPENLIASTSNCFEALSLESASSSSRWTCCWSFSTCSFLRRTSRKPSANLWTRLFAFANSASTCAAFSSELFCAFSAVSTAIVSLSTSLSVRASISLHRRSTRAMATSARFSAPAACFRASASAILACATSSACFLAKLVASIDSILAASAAIFADNLESSKAASASSARVVCSLIDRMKSARASSRSCARSLRSARSSSAARIACIFS